MYRVLILSDTEVDLRRMSDVFLDGSNNECAHQSGEDEKDH